MSARRLMLELYTLGASASQSTLPSSDMLPHMRMQPAQLNASVVVCVYVHKKSPAAWRLTAHRYVNVLVPGRGCRHGGRLLRAQERGRAHQHAGRSDRSQLCLQPLPALGYTQQLGRPNVQDTSRTWVHLQA